MLEKTRGIVLKLTPYGDTSVVAQIFTESFGLQSYMVHGAKKPRAKIRINMLQPLQLLDLVVYRRANADLQRISEARTSPSFTSIPYDMAKSSVVMFINEVLYKVLRHQDADLPLFQFVFNAVSWLDSVEQMPPDFHLYFLLRLTRYLGFQPDRRPAGTQFFDLKDGVYLSYAPAHPLVLVQPFVDHFEQLSTVPLEELAGVRLTREQRQYLLDKIIEYYRLHVHLGEIKSHAILAEVLS